MPDRWTRSVNPGDMTGMIGRELARKAKDLQQEKLDKYYADIEAAKAAAEKLKRPVRIAIENVNFDKVIDYTDGEAKKYRDEQRARTNRQLTNISPDSADASSSEE